MVVGSGMLLGILPTNVKRKKEGEANDVSEKCTVMDVWHMWQFATSFTYWGGVEVSLV